ncbi:isoprenylcysteine carboxylmethyltransferase family protein [Streptomyces sp. Wb2n-11]|uniref:methyltransferase family protein n=1 Tax=Streptomyces sp. Wb2n-11 TaxID=1030533 RepID=UPI000A95B2B1|nr:isoprenylcysteine carboxylmethyltransferase family protein [Streptomyces sp. Wb2n-11]
MKQWITQKFPALFFATGFLVGVGALVRAARDSSGPAFPMPAVMIAVYLCWVLLEARITFRTARMQDTEDDHGTEIVYGLSRFATVVAALYGPLPDTAPLWAAGPLSLVLAGIALRLVSIRTLGVFYSHRVRKDAEHRVATSGPYRLLRHPAYSGMILAHVGLVAYFLNPLSVALLLLAFVPAVVWRISVEEKVMSAVAGYRDFMAGRKRLVPFLW